MTTVPPTPLNADRRVLVVDGLPETEAVLKAVLEPKGIAVSRCRRNRLPEFERGQAPPGLLVVHDEPSQEPAEPGWDDVPRVVIGRFATESRDDRDPRILSNPFQYGELLSAIERLLPSGIDTNRSRAA